MEHILKSLFKTVRNHSKIKGKEIRKKVAPPKYDDTNQKLISQYNLEPSYSFTNGFSIKWRLKTEKNQHSFQGSINILPIEEVFGDWEEIVYFDFTEEHDRAKSFKIIDFFMPEACIGIFTDDENDNSLYYHDFEGEFYPLHLDMEGYINMLGLSYGTSGWQMAILIHQQGAFSKVIDDAFEKQMINLFPEFKLEEFIASYEEQRIEKGTVYKSPRE